MLNFEHIKEYFDPAIIARNPKGVLVEYLQYEVLDSLFSQPGSEKLSFIGGTAVRIIHNSLRFSEDLDFDNFGLKYSAFKILIEKVCAEMRLKGFQLENRLVKRGANFHAYLRFPDLLHKFGATGHRGAKIFLSLDAEEKKRLFQPELKTINRFGVFRNINVNPAAILLSQKLLAILFRKREKGRDFYDASFLAGKTKPDFTYINKLTGLKKEKFADRLVKRCRPLDFNSLARDVEAFLFDEEQKNRVLNFKQSLPDILA
jgi:predicted nucleotidyltransferase component of viral defense system